MSKTEIPAEFGKRLEELTEIVQDKDYTNNQKNKLQP